MSKVFATDPQQLIGQSIPVWYNPCNVSEEPSYRIVADARFDEDGHTILVKFHNEETGAIDYADHYCRIDTNKTFGNLGTLVRHLWYEMFEIKCMHSDARFEYRSIDHGDRYEISVGFAVGKYHATIRLTSVPSEIRFKLERFIW